MEVASALVLIFQEHRERNSTASLRAFRYVRFNLVPEKIYYIFLIPNYCSSDKLRFLFAILFVISL